MTKRMPIASLPRILASLCVCAALSGCVAAAVPIMYGMSAASLALGGFAIFKTVQLGTGGEVKIELSKNDPQPADRAVIRAARSIAVWPSKGGEGKLSDSLSRHTSLRVIAPGMVRRWVDGKGYERDPSALSASEKVDHSVRLARHLGADLVFLVESPKGVGVDASAWSFSRGQTEQEFTMTLVSRTPERIVWNEKGRLIVELGSESPSVDELSAIAAQAVAERVAELRR